METDSKGKSTLTEHINQGDGAPQVELTRRQFLKWLAAAAGIGAGGGYALSESPNDPISSITEAIERRLLEEAPEHSKDQEEHPIEKPKMSQARKTTAMALGGIFGGILVGSIIELPNKETGKKKPVISFGPGTVLTMTLAEIARISILNKHDPHAAEHDIKELKSGFEVFPALVALADMAHHVKVHNDKIMESDGFAKRVLGRVDSVLEQFSKSAGKAWQRASGSPFVPQSVIDFINGIEEPVDSEEIAGNEDVQESDSIERWEMELNKNRKEIITTAARNSAITSILAPITTTYTSSSIANESIQDMFLKLEKFNYSKLVIGAKKAGKEIFLAEDISRLKMQASELALKQINGKCGYLNLNLTLAANEQGKWGLGDPPIVAHLFSNPEMYAGTSAMGLASSELSTNVFNFAWLTSIGAAGAISYKDFSSEFIRSQILAFSSVLSSTKDNAFQQYHLYVPDALNPKRNQIKELLKELQQKGASGERIDTIIEKLQSIPQPAIHLNLVDMIRQKIDIVQNLSKPQEVERAEEIFRNMNFEQFAEEMETIEVTDKSKSQKIDSLLEGLKKARINKESSDAVATFVELLGLKNSTAGQPDIDAITSGLTDVAKSLNQTQDHPWLHYLMGRVLELQKTRDPANSEYIRVILREIYENVAVLGNKELSDILKTALEYQQENKESPNSSDDFIPEGETIHQEHHKPTFLSHGAQEVASVVGTQIFAVPAAIDIADMVLRSAFKLEEGQAPTREQFWNMAQSALIMTAAISGIADNLAAGFFGIGVLSNLAKETYGEDILDKDPEFKAALYRAAIFMAIVGGALSKIGNGPNLLLQLIDAMGNRQDIDFLPSLANPYSWADFIGTFAAMRENIESHLPQAQAA